MRVHHVGLWAADLERLRAFYVDVLGGCCGERYENPRTGFRSYFVSFGEGARLELMARADRSAPMPENARGLAHVALALGSRDAVDHSVARLRSLGVPVVGEPRTTGDGYYEAVIEDPEGNRIELVA